MNQRNPILGHLCFMLAITAIFSAYANNPTVAITNEDRKSAAIPIDQLGAVAGKQYQGDCLSVVATPDGARLRCAFQRLEGQVTREGLWLSSTADGSSGERFRVRAMAVGRVISGAPLEDFSFDFIKPLTRPSATLSPSDGERDGVRGLPPSGLVNVTANMARFIRPGLTEEYSVSVDGVRQDFVIEQRHAGDGELRVELEVTGAKAEPLVNGARLVLDGSKRKLAYNRLRVVDATGRELAARMEVASDGARRSRRFDAEVTAVAGNSPDAFEYSGLKRSEDRAPSLAVLVDDADAIYPVRIDPTFSDADWTSLGGFPGANNTVYAAATDSLGNLYIGGDFTVVGSVLANRIAKWDGAVWSTLGSGTDGPVRALATDGTNLYAGGEFFSAGGITAYGIAKWNGVAWSRLGPAPGIYGFVYALAVQGTNLYAGGAFSEVGFVSANCIAKWNGSAWSALGSGMTNVVRAVAVLGNDVYAGGDFTFAGGVSAHRIAKWDGSSWGNVGSGMNNAVHALAVSGGELYAGGWFSRATNSSGAPVTVSQIARWDGSSWFSMGSGLGGHPVFALAVSGSIIYAAGQASTLPHNIAKWDGLNWVNLGSGTESYSDVYTLATSGTNLYVGGDFISASGKPVNRIAKWGGSTWSPVGSGINGIVSALAVMGSDLYAGGTFTTAGSVPANHIAKWDGNTWSALGAGVSGGSFPYVYALAVSGTNLYVGGGFKTAGETATNHIAKWDGITWSSLGSGVSSHVLTLAMSGTNLYAGGWFTMAGGTPANRIAKWDGSAWSALGTGMNNWVYALAVSGTNLYAGGSFSTAGGAAAQSVAKWDGITWSGLGTGMGGNVYALAASGSTLYAGGDFISAGGVSAFRIAQWDGSSNWFALGSGMNNTVNALAMLGNRLYAGGRFTTADGSLVKGIAKLGQNGWSQWSSLGSGIGGFPDSHVKVLAVAGSDLYAGGEFITAGNKVSAYVAKANVGNPPPPGRFSNMSYSPVAGFSCTFSEAYYGYSYRIQTSPSLAAGTWTDFTNFTYTAPMVITDASALSGTNKFFRAITP